MDQPTLRGKEGFLLYLAIVAGSLAISIDFASVDLTLPALERQFALDLDSVQWVINGYVVAFSVLMITGGKLADAYGRKRWFLIGLGIFGTASLLGGFSGSGGSLIAFRVLQGVGAACLWPSMIGMGCGALGPKRSGEVLGIVMATCSVGNAAGPVIGGALTDLLSWRWVLWINVPMALLAFLITWRVVRDDRPPADQPPPKNDYAGIFSLTGGLVALMLMVYQGDSWGWLGWQSISLAVLAVVLLVSFPFIEARVREPLVPPELLGSPEIRTLCLSVASICALFFIVLLYFTQFALKFLGDTPTHAGLRMVSFMLSYGATAYVSGLFYPRLGARTLLIGGIGLTIVAAIYLGIFGVGSPPLLYNAGMILLGLGVGSVIPTASSRAIETAGHARASLASGLSFLAQLAGAALLMAVATAVFTTTTVTHFEAGVARRGKSLTSAEAQVASAIIARADTVHQIPKQTIEALPDFAGEVQRAYSHGLRWVLWSMAALCTLTLLAVLRYVPRIESPPAGPPTGSGA